MRIQEHPILNLKRGALISFTYNGLQLEGYEGETIAAALHAAGIKTLSRSHENHRARGFFCAIGNCSSCLMEVNGKPSIRVCVEPLKDGMVINTQEGRGELV